MGQPLNPIEETVLSEKLRLYAPPMLIPKLLPPKFCWYSGKTTKFKKYPSVRSSSKDCLQAAYQSKRSPEYKADYCNEGESEALPYVQTLREIPKEELAAKVVMVRFDGAILLKEEINRSSQSVSNAIFTIKYICEAGGKVILVSNWRKKFNSKLLDTESAADTLSSLLQHKVVVLQCISSTVPLKMEVLNKADIFLLENLSDFKEEVANCLNFAEVLSSGVDIFVNDSFSLSHKILASTVAVARFCSAHVVGFHSEESLDQLRKAADANRKPYIAIVGGGNLYDKAAALHFLASKCDGLVFIGMMSFQILHALGYSVPSSLIEPKAHKAAEDIIHFAHDRNIPILYPKDFWCVNDHRPNQMEVLPAHGIMHGWSPVDLGPRSLDEINSLLIKCKKIIWIGPLKFKLSSTCVDGVSKLAQILGELSKQTCDVTVVGNMACKAIMMESSSLLDCNMIESASVVWEFFKGRKLPGIMALDRAYPFEIDWSSVYNDPAQPLVVDIGSGICCFFLPSNGLFLLGMARRRKDLNFLGLEINKKLVRRCLDSVHQSSIWNGHFISTNATTTFRSIVSSYPGELVLVSIQCPNPDFNNPEHRWRMLQRSLVEAVTDLLAQDGKVFLQSDVEEVAVRMKELFLKYGKGRFTLSGDRSNTKIDKEAWLKENPFRVRSDWEQHVLDRGAPMYRLMLSKSPNAE
ncbi:phosphoglycerate kinase isoform X2 [Manihot esculenta]|uniref:phosphoglycerate kinase isoform X2 n=1 Tax=Manihot esculenta TaxID=3983 RepID=UPI001CC59C62|nr:phosphoglycerate kinase isoform X2 [Manihot esculenta]